MQYRFFLMAALFVGGLSVSPAYAQKLTGERQIQYGDIVIPASQAQSPAGHDDIGFRPACRQLVPILQANNTTAWTLQLPDGQTRILEELPPTWSAERAHVELNSAGLCKHGTVADGVVDVPIIYTADLPADVLPTPMVAPIAEGEEPSGVENTTPQVIAPVSEDLAMPEGPIGMLLGGGLIAVVAGVGVWFKTRKPAAKKSRPDMATHDNGAVLLGGAFSVEGSVDGPTPESNGAPESTQSAPESSESQDGKNVGLLDSFTL